MVPVNETRSLVVGRGRTLWRTSGGVSWCRCCGPIRTCGRRRCWRICKDGIPSAILTVCCAPCSGGLQPGAPRRALSGRSSSARSIPGRTGAIGFHRRLELTGDDRRGAVCPPAVSLLAGVLGLAVRQGDPGRGKLHRAEHAKVPLARRLAVILHRMWVEGTDFQAQPA